MIALFDYYKICCCIYRIIKIYDFYKAFFLDEFYSLIIQIGGKFMIIENVFKGGIRRIIRPFLYIIGRDCTPSDHSYKEDTVKRYAKKYECNVFLETGTYKAEMDKAVYNNFEYLSSVEIQNFIYERNLEELKNYEKLHLYNGDSTVKIPIMLDDIKEHYKNKRKKICFWLDGHYSAGDTGKGEKDTPILEELRGIKEAQIGECVILIDDARCFIHKGEFIDYPTIPYLKKYVKNMFHKCSFAVRGDIIRILVK